MVVLLVVLMVEMPAAEASLVDAAEAKLVDMEAVGGPDPRRACQARHHHPAVGIAVVAGLVVVALVSCLMPIVAEEGAALRHCPVAVEVLGNFVGSVTAVQRQRVHLVEVSGMGVATVVMVGGAAELAEACQEVEAVVVCFC